MNEENIKIVPNLYEAPSNPALGDTYYNINEDKYYGYDGSQWISALLESEISSTDNYVLKYGNFYFNILEITATGVTEQNGVTITVNEDKSITLNGTATQAINFTICSGSDKLAFLNKNTVRIYIKGRDFNLGLTPHGANNLISHIFMTSTSTSYSEEYLWQSSQDSPWEYLEINIPKGAVLNNKTLYIYATLGNGTYEYNQYGIENPVWTVEEFTSFKDLQAKTYSLEATDVEIHQGSLTKLNPFIFLKPRTGDSSIEDVATLMACSLENGVYKYKKAAAIYPKIIFNKKIVEKLVTNTEEQNSMFFNNVLVYGVPESNESVIS